MTFVTLLLGLLAAPAAAEQQLRSYEEEGAKNEPDPWDYETHVGPEGQFNQQMKRREAVDERTRRDEGPVEQPAEDFDGPRYGRRQQSRARRRKLARMRAERREGFQRGRTRRPATPAPDDGASYYGREFLDGRQYHSLLNFKKKKEAKKGPQRRGTVVGGFDGFDASD